MKIIQIIGVFILNFFLIQVSAAHAMEPMSDEQLSAVDAQSLISLSNIRDDSQGINFYKLGFEVDTAFNLNAKSLQLGCGGVNGEGGCDIDISNISFGCITGAEGNCITLETKVVNQPKGLDSKNEISNQTNMKDFVLTNPFFQFAIKNADSAATREVVGIRIGADNSEGPLSFGSLDSFSGYLSGKANLTMQGENRVSPVTKETSFYKNENKDNVNAFLGLDDATIFAIEIPFVGTKVTWVNYSDVLVNYKTVTRNDLAVAVEGNRVKQAQIKEIKLAGVVNDIMKDLSIADSCVRVVGICGGVLGTAAANLLLSTLSGGIGEYIKKQLAKGLDTDVGNLDNYVMPYNLSNVHQIDVKSNSFGIALSKESIKYPDYDVAVSKGWSMYLKDAFTLNIDDKVSNLVHNIAASPNAKQGNITLLAPAYRNCYGNLTYC